jgi:hypothetical protein
MLAVAMPSPAMLAVAMLPVAMLPAGRAGTAVETVPALDGQILPVPAPAVTIDLTLLLASTV